MESPYETGVQDTRSYKLSKTIRTGHKIRQDKKNKYEHVQQIPRI